MEHQRSVGAGSHTVTRVTWCAPPPSPLPPRLKISSGVLDPEIEGAEGAVMDVPGAHTYLPPRVPRWPGSPSPARTSLTHGNCGLGHAALTKATPTPCPQVTSLTPVPKSSVTRPSRAPPSNPHTLRGGGRDVKKEGQKPCHFLTGGSLCAVLSSYLGCLTNPATCMSPHTLSWGARRGGPWRPPRKNEGIQEGPGFPGGR